MAAEATTAAQTEMPTFGKKHGLRWARLEKKYKIGDMLGEGNFAKVYRGVCKKSGEEFALKVVQKKSVDLKRLAQEVAILSKLKHAHIMGFRECIETKTKVVMICEVLEGGELFDRVVAKGSYSEQEAALVSRQLLEAVDHAHAQDIVHRDLKPENIILTKKGNDTDVKISDFGLAKMLDESQLTSTLCGTPMYVAPEILRGRTNPYGPKVDIWAIGVITYILLAGYPPFFDNDLAKLYRQIIDVDYEFDDEYWADISDEATEFIDSLLVPDPDERPTAAEALKHPWFQLAIGASATAASSGKQRVANVKRLGTFLDQQREQQSKHRAAADEAGADTAYVDSGDDEE